MKPIYAIAIMGWVVAGLVAFAAYRTTEAQAASSGAPDSTQLAAVLAQMTTDDFDDLYDRGNDSQTASGDWMNAVRALRSGVVPGTDIQLTLDQKTQLFQKALDGMAKTNKRLTEAAVVGGITRPQLDILAVRVPAKLARKEIKATAQAQAATATALQAAAEAAAATAIAIAP